MTVTFAYAAAALLLLFGTGLVSLALWYAERLDRSPVEQRPEAPAQTERPYREAA
jgi:hypothetical protein